MPQATCTACIKICPACQNKFECDVAGHCWCANVSVSIEMLVELRQAHEDCLCANCLAQASEGKMPCSASDPSR